MTTIHKTASEISGKKRKIYSNNISDSTRKQTEKRRQMKMDGAGIQNVEYTETSKIITKELREDIRNFNSKMIKITIEQTRSVKKVKKNLAQGRQKITGILDSNRQEVTDQDELLKRIEEFYERLYDSDSQTKEPEESNRKATIKVER